MFRPLDSSPHQVEVILDGKPVMLKSKVTVAAALLEQDVSRFGLRPVSGAARAAYCMMGSCFECVLEIDGLRQRSCQVRVSAGMQIRRSTEDAS